jgi:hypothetical protein
MPAGICKVKFFFQSLYNGWEEDWYIQGTNTDAVLQFIQPIIAPRSALLGKYNWISQIRVIDTGNQFVGSTQVIPAPNLGTINAGNITDTSWNAVKVRIQCGLNYRRTMILRGVPDSAITYNTSNQPVIAPSLKNLLNAWRTVAQVFNKNTAPFGLSLGILAITKGGANPKLPITGVGLAVTTDTTTITSLNHGYANGTPILIRGVQGTNLRQRYPGRLQVNGPWQTLNVTQNTFDIGLPTSTLTGIPTWQMGGTVRSSAQSFQGVTDAVALSFMRRKTGSIRNQPQSRAVKKPANF